MRFLHSMPRSWQACWPSAHSSTSASNQGQRAAKVRCTVAWPQAVGAWIPPRSGSPRQGKSEVHAALPCAQASGEAEGSRADPCLHPMPISESGSLSGLHHSPWSPNPEGGLEAPSPSPELLGSDTEDTGDRRAPCDGQPFQGLWSTDQCPWPLHAYCPTPNWDNRNCLQTLPRLPWGAQLLSSLSYSALDRPPQPLTCGTRDPISTTEVPLTEEPP